MRCTRCAAVLLAMALANAAACGEPEFPVGIPCSEADTCPPGQVCDPFDRRCRPMPIETECRQDLDCASGVCDDGTGRCVDGCRPETCLAGPCEVARCDGDMCVLERLCRDDETCCGGACVAAGCDDGNPCTDDSCGAQGCEHTPASGASCDDGVHCNGADTCMAGACQEHAGGPCGSPTVCDEGTGACVGCLGDTDCPAAEVGAWSACGGFGDVCDASGVASRTVTAYTCQNSVCVSQTATETEACERDTEGATCGSVMSGPWTSCAGFDDTCDASGTQSREVITHVCASEVCTAMPTTEEQACDRATDGVTCDDPVYGAWGTCSGFSNTCDETGTRTRSVTTFACADESCASVGGTESGACERDTDGNSCGSVTCGAWSACGGFSDTCDQTGTRTRQCTRAECSSGTCSTVNYTETGNCSRNTNGVTCGGTACGAWGTCNPDGVECGPGQRTRACQTDVCASGTCSGSAPSTQFDECFLDCSGNNVCHVFGWGGMCCPEWGCP